MAALTNRRQIVRFPRNDGYTQQRSRVFLAEMHVHGIEDCSGFHVRDCALAASRSREEEIT